MSDTCEPKEILDTFQIQESVLPVLEENRSEIVGQYLADQGMIVKMGILPLEMVNGSTIKTLLNINVKSHEVLAESAENIIGPYIYDGRYLPYAIAIWGPGSTE